MITDFISTHENLIWATNYYTDEKKFFNFDLNFIKILIHSEKFFISVKKLGFELKIVNNLEFNSKIFKPII